MGVQHDCSGIVDVTPFFWKFVATVVHLDYDKLKNTGHFKTIKDAVINKKEFILVFDSIQFVHNDISSLMYETLAYLHTKPQYTDEVELLRRALYKMETVIESHDMIATFVSLCSLF